MDLALIPSASLIYYKICRLKPKVPAKNFLIDINTIKNQLSHPKTTQNDFIKADKVTDLHVLNHFKQIALK